MKILNINIVNSKLLIDNNLVTILITNKINNLTSYNIKIDNLNAIMLEFKLTNFNKFIIYLHYFIVKNIKFIIGFNIYKNIFYIIVISNHLNTNIDYNLFTYKYFISYDNNDIKIINDYNLNLDKIIGQGTFGKVYQYHDNNVIKITSFNNGLNELINYLSLFYKIYQNNISFKLVEYTKIRLIKTKNINNKFMLGIVMNKYLTLNYMFKDIDKPNIKDLLLKFIEDIKNFNSNKIIIMDLKSTNILWDNNDKKIVLIDFDSIQINNIDYINYISSIYNTHICFLENNLINIDSYDIYGLIDILLYFTGISLYKLMIEMMDINNNKITNLKDFRIYLKNENNLIIIDIIKKSLLSYFKKFMGNYIINSELIRLQNLYQSNIFINIINKICKSTIDYNDLYIFIELI